MTLESSRAIRGMSPFPTGCQLDFRGASWAMKIGCLINLAIYGALVAGYYHWLEPTVESRQVPV